MTKDYQLMLFDGCTTNHYLDDLRAAPRQGQQEPRPRRIDRAAVLGDRNHRRVKMLDGVTEGQSINEIKPDLEDINREPGSKKQMWKADGFNDN